MISTYFKLFLLKNTVHVRAQGLRLRRRQAVTMRTFPFLGVFAAGLLQPLLSTAPVRFSPAPAPGGNGT